MKEFQAIRVFVILHTRSSVVLLLPTEQVWSHEVKPTNAWKKVLIKFWRTNQARLHQHKQQHSWTLCCRLQGTIVCKTCRFTKHFPRKIQQKTDQSLEWRTKKWLFTKFQLKNVTGIVLLIMKIFRQSKGSVREYSSIAGVPNLLTISYHLGTPYCQRVPLLPEQLIWANLSLFRRIICLLK